MAQVRDEVEDRDGLGAAFGKGIPFRMKVGLWILFSISFCFLLKMAFTCFT